MKRLLLVLGLTISLGAQAQLAFKGQLHVSDMDFSVQGSLLRVQMRVSYDKNLLNPGETLNFMPVLKTDFEQQDLSSVVITGKTGGGQKSPAW